MKIIILSLSIFVFSIMNAQLEGIHTFKTKVIDEDYTVYKIRKELYKTDWRAVFLKGKSNIIENNKDDILHFMIFQKKYLFVGYYINTNEQRLSSLGYNLRPLHKLQVISLDNPTKKWNYNFKGITTMSQINSFNPIDGDIKYCNHNWPEKVL